MEEDMSTISWDIFKGILITNTYVELSYALVCLQQSQFGTIGSSSIFYSLIFPLVKKLLLIIALKQARIGLAESIYFNF